MSLYASRIRQESTRPRAAGEYKLNDRIKRHTPGTVKTVPGVLFLTLQRNTFNLTHLCRRAAADKIVLLLSPIWQQKGGDTMTDILITFLVSVLASVTGHYICKWLDSDDDSN